MSNTYKDFLKARYPNRYSDSLDDQAPSLSKDSVLFFLGNLSSQNKEHEFESFCRTIIRSTIAPNLIIQTGPTGGGDSKVDSETYPVDETLAEIWPYPESINASGERWAFAMSIKRDWRAKAQSDVRKIRAVEDKHHRGYTKVFFISNQFISDKKRSEVEDSLRSETQLDIRILDLNWLAEKVLESGSGRKAIVNELGMSADCVKDPHNGINDSSRVMRLTQIDKQLNDEACSLFGREKIELADEAAEISGRLELPDETIEGYLERHYRLAKKYGNPIDIAKSVYLYAYRVATYYDEFDMNLYYSKYLELESIALENRSKFIIEELITLWTILYSQAIQNQADDRTSEVNCIKHAETLMEIENELAESGNREVAAIEVSMRMIPVRLMTGEEPEKLLKRVIELLEKSKSYRTVDCEILVEMFKVPDVFDECDLLDTAMELLFGRVRDDEGANELAPSLFARGVTLEQAGRIEKAIGMYTRAAICIRSGDDKINLVKTLLRLSFCYEEIGLRWFSRSSCCLALNLGIDSYFGDSYLFSPMVHACNRLKYLELSSGRLPSAIKLDNLESYLSSLFPESERLTDDTELFNEFLAMCSLLIDPEELRNSTKLSSQLHNMGYPYAAQMVDYSKGHYNPDLLRELNCTKDELDALIEEHFSFADGYCHFVGRSSFSEANLATLSTKLLGCTINVTTPYTWSCYETATTILASIEGFFGTGLERNLYATRETIDISISFHPESDKHFEMNTTDEGFSVQVGNLESIKLSVLRKEVGEMLTNALSRLTSLMAPLGFSIKIADAMASKDFAIDRAFGFSNTITEFGSFIEDLPFEPLEEDDDITVEYVRTEPLRLRNTPDKQADPSASKVIYGHPPDELSAKPITHSSVLLHSVIDQHAWDNAGWLGLGYIACGDGRVVLAFIFNNPDGKLIFQHWKEKGQSEIDRIRIGIIKGISRENSLSYRAVVTSTVPASDPSSKPAIITTLARMKTIEPQSLDSLNNFERQLEHGAEVAAVPAFMSNGELKCQWENLLPLKKNALSIVEARDITKDDYVSCIGLLPSDDPIVPDDDSGNYAIKIIKEKRRLEQDRLTDRRSGR